MKINNKIYFIYPKFSYMKDYSKISFW